MLVACFGTRAVELDEKSGKHRAEGSHPTIRGLMAVGVVGPAFRECIWEGMGRRAVAAEVLTARRLIGGVIADQSFN